jgi:hypothetical protein
MGRTTKADGPGGVPAGVSREAVEAAVRRVCDRIRELDPDMEHDVRVIEHAMTRWLAVFRPDPPARSRPGPSERAGDVPGQEPGRSA